MLTEHFIAAIGASTKKVSTSIAKDASIFLYEHLPLVAPRSSFKKSATPPNCLAVSDSHIFAAQADKAVVHVYSRDRGNQEATVPFTERITCLALACEDAVLILGTAEGRLFLWEIASGRQVTTAQSHLQAVTELVVDAASNFLVSSSFDSTCHVWSIPALLSFVNAGTQALAPVQSFSAHRSAVRTMSIGHSEGFQNTVFTAAEDKTCLIWNYQTCVTLRTYLLPYVPTTMTVSGDDRALFFGYETGSVQRIDLYALGNASIDTLHDSRKTQAPLQPKSKLWEPSDKAIGATCSLALSFDGMTLLSGHESGAILSWDVATGQMRSILTQGPLSGPVHNLSMLPIPGFEAKNGSRVKLESVTKPRFGAFQAADSDHGAVPGNYALNIRLQDPVPCLEANRSLFQQSLSAPCFPASVLDEGLSELASWTGVPVPVTSGTSIDHDEDFMALENNEPVPQDAMAQQQVIELKAQLDALRRVQQTSFDKMEKLQMERKVLLQREHDRLVSQARKGASTKVNGNGTTQLASESDDSGDDLMDSDEESD
ncbi:Pre-rRNA-processing protein ipi3 [Oleoguttula sp. CCFEE 5521]